MELKIRGLTKEFTSYDQSGSKVIAVDNINLDVQEGELVTLLGPSGCGKTTLLRMIAGFEDPTSGDIFFGSKRVNDLAPNRRNTTLVFQSYAIFPHLNVYENIAFGLRLKDLSQQKIEERMRKVIDLVGLQGLESRQPSQLSGGQQQRVALARAIIMEPQLLLFDEPLSNLDAKLREQMRIEIRSLQKRLGITSVYVTHDQAEAMSISDRVVVMNHGKIEQIGSPRDLYAKPRNPFVAAFIGKVNFLHAHVSDKGDLTVMGEKIGISEKVEPSHLNREITITIRPESIKLFEEYIPQEQPLSGKITRTTFLGNIVEYELEITGDTNLIVHTVNPVSGMIFSPGATVGVSFIEDALHLLEGEE